MKPELGDMLYGGRVFSSSGVDEWQDYPAYRVVGFHFKEPLMFIEILDRAGKVASIEKMDINSDQWMPCPPQLRFYPY